MIDSRSAMIGIKPVGKNIVDGFDIIDGSGRERPDRCFVELGKIQAQYLFIYIHPQILYHSLAQPCGDKGKIKPEDRFDQQ